MINFLANVPSTPFDGANISTIGLVLVIVAASFYLLGLILRACKLRSVSRVMVLLGNLSLVGYTSLFFVDVPGFDVWMIQDYADLVLFVASILLAIHSLVMVIRKR